MHTYGDPTGHGLKASSMMHLYFSRRPKQLDPFRTINSNLGLMEPHKSWQRNVFRKNIAEKGVIAVKIYQYR